MKHYRDRLKEFQTIIFDCDGVLLNSNHLKTNAFYVAASKFGERAAKELVAYHLENGGVSRYEKANYLFQTILQTPSRPGQIEEFLETYSKEVRRKLVTCEEANGLRELRNFLKNSVWIIVSGGDEEELRQVFYERGLISLFNGGIYGSPLSKFDIVSRELQTGKVQRPVLFIGDSRLDYEVAVHFEFEFYFVSEWSEFEGLLDYAAEKRIKVFRNISEI